MLKSASRWIAAAGLLGLAAAGGDARAGATYPAPESGHAARFRSLDDGSPGRVVEHERRDATPGDRHRRPVVTTPRGTAGVGMPPAGGGPVVYRIREVAPSGASKGRVVAYEVRSLTRAGDAPSHGEGGFDGLIDRWARSLRMEPALVKAVVAAESGFDPEAISAKGAQGLMQLMPDTARALGVRRPFDPEDNVRGGTRYLRQMLDRYGDLQLALAAYNAGPTAVDRHGGIPPAAETQAYVRRVLDFRERYRATAMKIASSAPTAAASVGVDTPP